ncbi:unnamed protein product [Lactuca virosa]|uniref:Saccharopine dehydrogenase NADP binding domain-containing protein n=1 Tax=Lactuca virosa TaxID=75947 RepID=A0AAU9NIW0_9ASTR|nr:unnamed protein product [Lactuca virosa]
MGKLPADEFFRWTSEMSLVECMRNVMTSEDPKQAVDPKLLGNGYEEQMLLLLKIACFCKKGPTVKMPGGKGNRISELLLIRRRGFTNGEGEETTTGGVWREAKLVLDCVGPFRLYGEPVVAACVEAGCDYLDISGEPEFMERMEAVYHEKAVEKGSLVISACGFDSIPAEIGLMFNSRQWVSPAAPNRIPGPPPPKGSTIEHQKQIGLWAVKLPSTDATVVRRTLSILTENPNGLEGVSEDPKHAEKRSSFWSTIKPAHFGVKIATKNLLGMIGIIAAGISIGLLGIFSFGRWLLLKFPSFFSFGGFRKEGPTEEEVASASFKMWFIGHGFSESSPLHHFFFLFQLLSMRGGGRQKENDNRGCLGCLVCRKTVGENGGGCCPWLAGNHQQTPLVGVFLLHLEDRRKRRECERKWKNEKLYLSMNSSYSFVDSSAFMCE